ncbi:MAG: zinc ribbon domain-containing protein [Chloroflexota bacterium]|nr:MAG: zinc ribbon domain-containing protein [Chloroflexota bacterium]
MEHILACPKCNTPNRFGESLCRSCGQDLAHSCSRCQVGIDPGMAYCPYCGEILPVWPAGQSLVDEEPSKEPDVILELT